MIVTSNDIAFTVCNSVGRANNSHMLNVGRRVLVAIQRIVLAHGTGRAFERIVNADQLRGLGVIGSVAAADCESSTASIRVFD